MIAARAVWIACLAAGGAGLGGCGLGLVDSASGGDDHLPTQGAGPYGKPTINFDTPADEPYVVVVSREHLRDPAALARDGGGFRLWFGHEPDPMVRAGHIATAALVSTTELPESGPTLVLAADGAWEEGWIGAPAVVREGSGGDRLVMFYQGSIDNPGIGRADSDDGGLSWRKHPSNPLMVGAAPTVSRLPDESWLMYLTMPARLGIYRAVSTDGIRWTVDEAAALLPRGELVDAFDRSVVSEPFVVARETAAGTLHIGLFFTGTAGDVAAGEEPRRAIGWAGSFDGVTFTRFASPDEPVLAAGGIDESGPCVLLEADRGIMFFHEERQGVDRITVAFHP